MDNDSFVITGSFSGMATFGKDEPTMVTLAGIGDKHEWDVFVAKYNINGNLEWAKSAVGPGRDEGSTITTLGDGSCLMAGYFEDTISFVDEVTNITTLSSVQSTDIFLARYKVDGTLEWAVSAGGPDFDATNGIESVDDGSVLLTGTFFKEITFGLGMKEETTLYARGLYHEVFVASYRTDGTLNWARHVAASEFEGDILARDIVANDDGSFALIGDFNNVVVFGPDTPCETTIESDTTGGIFVARFHSDGGLAWVRIVDGIERGIPNGNGIDLMIDGSVFATGGYYGKATFCPGEANEITLEALGGDSDFDAFVMKLGP
jgi:hypothetical protein